MKDRHRQGLSKLSPDLIDKASDETASQVVRLMLTFVGTAAFCLLSLASPDSGLLTSNEKLNVPFAGPVSFFGFMLLGPAVLIVLRVYLQIYVEHGDKLNRIAQRMPIVRAPTLVPLKNPLIRAFSVLTFYFLLPVTMLVFAWKAAVFARWGSGLLCVAAGVIASHAMLPLRKISWRTRALLSVSVAILAGGAMLGFGPLQRSFDLDRADLHGTYLFHDDLHGAKLNGANLEGANLIGASLIGAGLSDANLEGANLEAANLHGASLIGAGLNTAFLLSANLSDANLSGANLEGANLSANLRGANLEGANLSGANLIGANLSDANLHDANLHDANLHDAHLIGASLEAVNLEGANLSGANLIGANLSDAKLDGQHQIDGACGTDAKLPPGLTLRPCSP
jgi:uncharacterized protein YjbI with pentapeptide repeats